MYGIEILSDGTFLCRGGEETWERRTWAGALLSVTEYARLVNGTTITIDDLDCCGLPEELVLTERVRSGRLVVLDCGDRRLGISQGEWELIEERRRNETAASR